MTNVPVRRYTKLFTSLVLSSFLTAFTLFPAMSSALTPMPGCYAGDDYYSFSGANPPGNTFSGTVAANDSTHAADGTVYSYGYYQAITPHGGNVTLSVTGQFEYLPPNDYVGEDSFGYYLGYGNKMSGGVEYCSFATVYLTINAAGYKKITVQNDTAATISSESVTVDVLANDTAYATAYSQPRISAVENLTPGMGTFTITNDPAQYGKTVLTFTPMITASGQAEALYTLMDGYGNTATAVLTITVTPNQPPLARADSGITAEDAAFMSNVLSNDTDAENDPLSVTAYSQPQHGAVTVMPNGDFTYNPAPNYFGVDAFTYTVSDSHSTSTQVVSLTVAPVNDPLTAVDDYAAISEDTAISGNVLTNDFDVDSTVYGVSSWGQPEHGTVVGNSNGSYTYIPAANYFGTDNFVYTVRDSEGATATGHVYITVAPVNDAPVANYVVTRNKAKVYTFDASSSYDVDGAIINYAWDFGDGTSLNQTSPAVSHTYKKMGTYTVVLTVTDNSGAITSYRQTLTVK